MRRVLKGAAMLLASLVSVAVLLASGYAFYLWRAFDTGLQAAPVSLSALDGNRWSLPSGVNVLLIGTDDRSRLTDEEAERYATGRTDSVLTDTIIVLHVPPDDAPADVPPSLVSVPRDSWVQIPGESAPSKINSAYERGGGGPDGAELLARTVADVTGLAIHHTVLVDFASFARITEAVGPVEVCLLEPTSDPTTGLELEAGWQELPPEDALKFVRQRQGLPQGDLSRVARQQAYLTAAFKAIRANVLDPGYLANLARTTGNNLFVDDAFPGEGHVTVAGNAAIRLAGQPVRNATLPVADINARIDGQSVVLLDEAAIPGFIASLDQSTPTPDDPPSESPGEPDTEPPTGPDEGDGDGPPPDGQPADPACVY